MRVLTAGNMYPPHHLGGYELTWRSSVLHLRDGGHEVRVLTTDHREAEPDPAFPEDEDVHRELRWYWRDHDFPPIPRRARLALERHNARVLDRHLRDFQPDAVAWWAMGGMSLGMLEQVRRTGLPAVGVVGDDWMRYGPKVDAWQRFCRRLGPASRALELVTRVPCQVALDHPLWLFNSETVRRRALEATRRPLDSRVAHPGIDESLFGPRERQDGWRWRLLYVGRIDERKGIDTAIEALAALPAEARLTVLGGGDREHLAELRRLADRLGVANRTEFGHAPRDRLPAAYAAADVVLFPVRWEEPWGLVPLEAMSVGVPVVATGTGGSGEYLEHERNALIFERDRPDLLAAAVERLAAQPELRASLVEEGRATARPFTELAYNEAIEAALVERAAAAHGTMARA